MSKKIIILDFDGVVWDSVGECFEQAWLAFALVHGPLTIDRDRARTLFRAARWQCKDGYDFCIVLGLLQQGRTDVAEMPAAEFRAMRQTLGAGPEAERMVAEFYASRERMRTTDFAHWTSLQDAYPGMVGQIAAMREGAAGVAIATTKDAPSARALLDHAGVADMVIYGREVSLDKRDHMRVAAKQFNVDTRDLVFVDDLLENLLGVRDLGVRLALAGWGYNTEHEREQAARDGVPVAAIDSLAETVLSL